MNRIPRRGLQYRDHEFTEVDHFESYLSRVIALGQISTDSRWKKQARGRFTVKELQNWASNCGEEACVDHILRFSSVGFSLD